MSYSIGLTQEDLLTLDSLGLENPLSDYQFFSAAKTRGDGTVVGLGRVSFSWKFNILTNIQFQTLLTFLSIDSSIKLSNWVYVTTRVPVSGSDTKQFKTFYALMVLAQEPRDARFDVNEKYLDVKINFLYATEVTE